MPRTLTAGIIIAVIGLTGACLGALGLLVSIAGGAAGGADIGSSLLLLGFAPILLIGLLVLAIGRVFGHSSGSRDDQVGDTTHRPVSPRGGVFGAGIVLSGLGALGLLGIMVWLQFAAGNADAVIAMVLMVFPAAGLLGAALVVSGLVLARGTRLGPPAATEETSGHR